MRRNIYETQYDAAMLVYIRDTPTWRPENTVNMWNLLWLSRRLIISTEKTSIYISTFPDTLTSEYAEYHELSIYFSKNGFVAFCQNALVSRRSKRRS